MSKHPSVDKGRSISGHYQAWYRACEAAKLSGRVPHDFRPTAVSELMRAGILERVAIQGAGT